MNETAFERAAREDAPAKRMLVRAAMIADEALRRMDVDADFQSLMASNPLAAFGLVRDHLTAQDIVEAFETRNA